MVLFLAIYCESKPVNRRNTIPSIVGNVKIQHSSRGNVVILKSGIVRLGDIDSKFGKHLNSLIALICVRKSWKKNLRSALSITYEINELLPKHERISFYYIELAYPLWDHIMNLPILTKYLWHLYAWNQRLVRYIFYKSLIHHFMSLSL